MTHQAETSERLSAPERIWATVNGASTRLPDGGRQLIGGWSQDKDRPRSVEYVRADILSALPNPPEGGVKSFQDRVAAAHVPLFHGDPTDLAERRDRFYEEANETVQALGMTADEAHQLVDYTFGRPAGDVRKEIGAAALTLASLCVVGGWDMMECAEADLSALQTPEKIAKVRAKRATRHGRGPLPGLPPASPDQSELEKPTHRHKKRGTEYVLIGMGRMQAEGWVDEAQSRIGHTSDGPHVTRYRETHPVDMREVAIYRSVDDGSLWVRPREEFEDGRFEALTHEASNV